MRAREVRVGNSEFAQVGSSVHRPGGVLVAVTSSGGGAATGDGDGGLQTGVTS